MEISAETLYEAAALALKAFREPRSGDAPSSDIDVPGIPPSEGRAGGGLAQLHGQESEEQAL